VINPRGRAGCPCRGGFRLLIGSGSRAEQASLQACSRGRAATHLDAYARAVLVREFIHERRSVWVRRVSLGGTVGDAPAAVADQDVVLDLRAAVAALPANWNSKPIG
jgi:hypothetical protein